MFLTGQTMAGMRAIKTAKVASLKNNTRLSPQHKWVIVLSRRTDMVCRIRDEVAAPRQRPTEHPAKQKSPLSTGRQSSTPEEAKNE
ncbi:hypothetical protein [Bradyrhizobium sp. Tv2a-2]|uniref:hypothetical protein n=1 Tax=Bradyrhizobium sp. Tv2a-2 TaxID=113395 RepID=UPI0012EC3074|nr:hypothetical protein [Bradyrhizobium sp. Tv2a-2]